MRRGTVRLLALLVAGSGALAGAACGTAKTRPSAEPAAALEVPPWSGDAIWYQIFVERFRNGDPGNDPTAHDIAGVTDQAPPRGWQPTPWGHDWSRQEPWARASRPAR